MSLARRAAGLLWALLLVIGMGLAASPSRAAPSFPALTGRVVDQAHVLSPETQAQLTQSLGALETKTSRQLIVVTLPSLNGYDIADYGYQLGRAWGVGQKGLDNGVLFIIAPSEHKVRIEVGYGLEPIITDALSNQILQRQVLPEFRKGDVQGGVVAGVQALVDQLSLDPSVAELKAAQAAQGAQVGRSANPIPLIIFAFVMLWAMGAILGGGRGGGGAGWLFPLLLLNGGLGRRSFDDEGFGGGGGFSGGGGGSFGGGGSSGSW